MFSPVAWIRKLWKKWTGAEYRAPIVNRPQNLHRRLSLELLEDRIVPSTPAIEDFAINNISPKTNEIVIVQVGTLVAGDAVRYEYKVNGVTKRDVITSALTDSLDLSQPGNGDKGDTLVVKATPIATGDDKKPTVYGQSVSATATVANTAPVISSVTLDNPSPKTNDLLTATVVASDADGDPITIQ